jgi:hypothetical protein
MARRLRIASLALVVGVLCAVFTTPASAAPSNDDFGDARALRLGAEVAGTVNGATRQRGEPRHAQSLASRSVWYRFRARRKTTVLLGTCRSNFDTVVAVYSGRRLRSLRAVDFNNDGCGEIGAGSRVSFTARRGRTYRIAVAGFRPSGRFTLLVNRLNAPPNDDFVDAAPLRVGGPSVAGTLRNSTRELREPLFEGETSTVWFRLRVAQQTVVELSACEVGADPYLAVYTGRRLSHLRRIVAARDCVVQFTAKADITYRIQVTMEPELQGPFRIRARALQ